MRLLFAVPIMAALSAVPAIAAPITKNFDIETSGFTDITGLSTPPVDLVSLVVSLTFDPTTGDQFDNAAGLRLLRSSVPVAGGLAFDYDSVNDILTFGGAGLGGIGIAAGTGDVLAVVDAPYTGPASFGGFIYATRATTGIYESFAGTVTVPEPGSLAVLLGSLALMAAWRRRA